MRFSPELIEKIDRWREKQIAVPIRAAAIRALVELAIKVAERNSDER
jgi:hypothetical protein